MELTVNGGLDALSEQQRNALKKAIEDLLQGEAVKVSLGKNGGFELQLAPDQAECLHAAVKDGDLKAYEVADAEFVSDRYISRDKYENDVLSWLCERQPDGSHPRLVTLCGRDGMGKTWLARECEARLRDAGEDVAFVSLSGKGRSREPVAEAIGMQLNTDGVRVKPEEVEAVLRDKNAVLILDNADSECSKVRDYLQQLLRQSQGVRLLVIGHKPIALDAVTRHLDRDSGMEPSEAAELFIARTRLRKGMDWEPGTDEENDIQRIIEKAEWSGMPIGPS